MKKLMLLATVIGLLVSGCATSRVWQSRDTREPSSNEEVAIAIEKCESTEIVTNAHKTVHTWRVVAWATVCLWPVGIIGIVGEQSAQKDYVGALVNCMREANFEYFEYTKGINWDYHSGSDMSKSEWLDDQKPKEGISRELFVSGDDSISRYYHRDNCVEFRRRIGMNREIKLTREQAERRGLLPCPSCKP